MAGEHGTETQVVAQVELAPTTVIEKHPVAESLRAELLKLTTDGDAKHKGALTEEVLARIVRVAKTGRDLLVSLNLSGSNLAALARRPRRGGALWMGGQDMADDDLGDGAQTAGGPFAYSSPTENFGMTALRELISVAKNQFGGGTSPAKLVEAIAIAREKGLTDIAKDLESQLGLPKPTPVALPAPADGKGA